MGGGLFRYATQNNRNNFRGGMKPNSYTSETRWGRTSVAWKGSQPLSSGDGPGIF